jgi:hydroxymethylpyrimidine/phosphomethylpyrimidine kinase
MGIEEAVREAKRFVTGAIRGCYRWGGVQALNHQAGPGREGSRGESRGFK